MNSRYKCILAIAPLFLAACEDKIDMPVDGPVAYEGDDVRFTMDNSPISRTMYQDNWDEKNAQAIYWGNYTSSTKELVNIYSPDTDRGFAEYQVNPQSTPNQAAESILKTSEIGVQWGASGKPYTFYAFYPADKASTTLANGNTVRATVVAAQSPQSYKYKETGNNAPADAKLQPITNFDDYNSTEYDATNQKVNSETAKTIYGMPEMKAAVMVARQTMDASKYGEDVPLSFHVLADVLDITLNGPITPNTLGGNKNSTNPDGIQAAFIQIQAVTLEVVKPVEGNATDDKGNIITDISQFEIDNSVPITGSFDFNMSKDVADTPDMVTNVSGNAFVQMQTATIDANNKISYPTLYVRTDIAEGAVPTEKDIDHLRLRAFLIPGQITANTLHTLRLHLQTNCGDFYMMLEDDSNFTQSKIYPLKLGYFKTRGEDFNIEKWISQLDPNIFISELSIPGAWHAANANYQGADVSMSDLYKAGIRAFEVHTKNGTSFVKYGDKNFAEGYDISKETENFEEPFTLAESKYEIPTATSNNDGVGNGTNISSGTLIGGTTYYYRREVTGTAGTCTERKTETAYTVPRFWLRLYRSATGSEPDPISTAIIDLAQQMNPTGLMFLEIGMDGATGIDGVPTRGSRTTVAIRTQNNVKVKGYQYGNRRGNFITGYTYTWEDVYTWETPVEDLTTTWTVESTKDDNTPGTINLNGEQAWTIAVRSCLERLAGTPNDKTGKDILYEGTLNRYTTIKDVQGTVIAKVNTNNRYNENNSLWGSDIPALFSRWISGSGKEPQIINLRWKAPIAPTPLIDDIEELHWCFSEREDIADGEDDEVTLAERKDAIIAMNAKAAANYKVGRHRTFYETSLGGFLTNNNAAGCQALAKELNPFALARITNPSREATPLGLVFMNYCIDKDNQCQSAELIRAIINNNKAFLLNRAGTAAPDVQSQANSHFNNINRNPLK